MQRHVEHRLRSDTDDHREDPDECPEQRETLSGQSNCPASAGDRQAGNEPQGEDDRDHALGDHGLAVLIASSQNACVDQRRGSERGRFNEQE